MVTLDTLLIASCISFGGGVLTTLGFGLLFVVARNTREKDDDSQFAIPLSSLINGPPGSGRGGPVGLMDLVRATQASQAADASPEDKKKDEKTPGGQYI